MLQTKAVEVHTVQGKSQRYERRKLSYQEEKKSENKKCYACGEGDLNFKECKYRKHKCKICIKIRHLAKVCYKNKDKINNKKNRSCYLDVENNDVEFENNVDVKKCVY